MKPDNKCLKCGGEFEPGVIADYVYGAIGKASWATEIKGFIRFTIKNKKGIVSYRCKNCGYLENYAN